LNKFDTVKLGLTRNLSQSRGFSYAKNMKQYNIWKFLMQEECPRRIIYVRDGKDLNSSVGNICAVFSWHCCKNLKENITNRKKSFKHTLCMWHEFLTFHLSHKCCIL
jgi:hypothetical protein